MLLLSGKARHLSRLGTHQSSAPTHRLTSSYLNFEKYYWLSQLSSQAAQQEIQGAQQSIKTHGVAFFPDFISKDALKDCIEECDEKNNNLHQINDEHNVYYSNDDKTLPPNHIRNRTFRTQVAIIPNDRLDSSRSLCQIYQTKELKQLIQLVLQKPELYRSADPLGRCSVNVLKEGWADGWHFDESEFSTTLMIQRPIQGGEFDVAPSIRHSLDDYAFEKVEQVVSTGTGYQSFSQPAGTLAIFAGSRSLHRVTTVTGHRDRYAAVFTFSTKKDFVNSPCVQEMFFGKVNQNAIISSD